MRVLTESLVLSCEDLETMLVFALFLSAVRCSPRTVTPARQPGFGARRGAFIAVLLTSLICVATGQNVAEFSLVPYLTGNFTDIRTPEGLRELLRFEQVTTYRECVDWFSRNYTAKLEGLREIEKLFVLWESTAEQVLAKPEVLLQAALQAGSPPDIGLLVTLRGIEEKNGELLSRFRSQCDLSSGNLGKRLLQAASGNISNVRETADVYKGVADCYLIGNQLVDHIQILSDIACPLLAPSGHFSDEQIRTFCGSSEGESSLQTTLRVQTSITILLIDTQITLEKLDYWIHFLVDNYTFVGNDFALNLSAVGKLPMFVCAGTFADEFIAADENGTEASNCSSNSYSSACFCSELCSVSRLFDNFLTQFISFAQEPLFSLNKHIVRNNCLKPAGAKDEACIDFDSNGMPYNSTASSIPPPKYCIDFSCKFPLIETSDPRHWYPNHQDSIKELIASVRLIFPFSVLPYNASNFPCGVKCSTIAFSGDDEKLMRTVRFACGLVGIVFSTIAVVAYALNREKLQKLPRRLNFYLNLAFLIGPGIDSLLAVGTDSMKIVYCHSDDTLRYDEPRDGMSWCLFFAMKFLFFSFMMGFLGMVLCHEWFMAIHALHKVRLSTLTLSAAAQRKREIVYLVVCIIGSGTLTAVIVSRKTIIGLPNTGGCLLRSRDQFYVFGVPLMVQTVIMLAYLIAGLPHLLKLFKGVSGYLASLGGEVQRRMSTASPAMAVKKRRLGSRSGSTCSNKLGLERLLHLLSLYIVLIFVSQMIVLPTFIHLFRIEDRVLNASGRHHECLSTYCNPSDCPPLHRVSPAVNIVPDVFLTVVGIVLSLWAFQWNVFWKMHFDRLTSNRCFHRSVALKQETPSNSRSTPDDLDKKLDDSPVNTALKEEVPSNSRFTPDGLDKKVLARDDSLGNSTIKNDIAQ